MFRRILLRLIHPLYRTWNLLRRPVTLGVKGAVFDAQGRVLLVKHSYTKGWHLPGGGVERNETLSQAVCREIKEELDLDVAGPLEPLAMYFAPHMGKSDHIALFRIEIFSGEVSPNHEIDEAAFFAPDDLPTDTTPATARRVAELHGAPITGERW